MVREECTDCLDKPSMLDQNGEPSGSSDPLLPLQTIAGFGCVQHTRLSPNDDRTSPYMSSVHDRGGANVLVFRTWSLVVL